MDLKEKKAKLRVSVKKLVKHITIAIDFADAAELFVSNLADLSKAYVFQLRDIEKALIKAKTSVGNAETQIETALNHVRDYKEILARKEKA